MFLILGTDGRPVPDRPRGLDSLVPYKTAVQSIRQLQLIQDAAARVVTNTKKVDHILPVLRSFKFTET